MPGKDRAYWKSNCFLKSIQLLDNCSQCFTVRADNVGSKEMQQILMSLRGKGCGVDGQEHHDAQGHLRASGKHPNSREKASSYPEKCGHCVHRGGSH
ncbi:hypothetical protein ACRRTK_020728 [Alexandromys fortis]